MTALKAAALITAAWVSLALVVIFCTEPDADVSSFNDWARACQAEGGIVALHHIEDDGSNWYECYVDGKQVTIP